jgi:hypothetical protein
MLINHLEHAWGRHALLPLFLTLLFAMSFLPARTQAQIVGTLEADVPFQFRVGKTTMPAGRYMIHELEGSELTVMQISSADGKLSALFEVESTQARTTPEKSELVFNEYGDRYFLSEMYDEGNVDGSRLSPSRDEKRASKENGADVAYVTARHAQQEGN